MLIQNREYEYSYVLTRLCPRRSAPPKGDLFGDSDSEDDEPAPPPAKAAAAKPKAAAAKPKLGGGGGGDLFGSDSDEDSEPEAAPAAPPPKQKKPPVGGLSGPFRVPVCAAPTLNAAGHPPGSLYRCGKSD